MPRTRDEPDEEDGWDESDDYDAYRDYDPEDSETYPEGIYNDDGPPLVNCPYCNEEIAEDSQRCPECGKGHMFRSWLKLVDRCANCGLDYRFASPDDGPAFFSQCIVAFPLTFVIVWLQIAYSPPLWVHLVFSIPVMVIGCILPLRPIKGWLVASQYVNKAQEAGTDALWAQLHARAKVGAQMGTGRENANNDA